MRHVFSAALACLLVLGAAVPSVQAQSSLRAAAIVNDDIVSMLDLILRLRIAIVQSGVDDTPEVRDRLTGPVLRNLIDERLQMQEAERLDIAVQPEQIDAAIDEIARNNRMTRSQFFASLDEQGIPQEALRDQLRAQIAWQGVVARRLAPQVDVSQAEVDETMRRIAADVSQARVRLAEIFVPFDSAADEAEARTTAVRLLEELRRGAPFQAVAQQFSQSATAATGGDMGWLAVEELPEELADPVRGMREGQLAGPIRGIGGYYILALIGRRAAENVEESIQLARFVVPANGADEVQAATAQAARLAQEVQSCAQADRLAQDYAGEGIVPAQPLEALDPAVRTAVEGLSVGESSAPLTEQEGAAVYTVCLRDGGGLNRQAIEADLRNERLELLSRRYMRDLRRDANVEIRI